MPFSNATVSTPLKFASLNTVRIFPRTVAVIFPARLPFASREVMKEAISCAESRALEKLTTIILGFEVFTSRIENSLRPGIVIAFFPA